MSEGLPHVERELPEIAGGGATCLSLSPAPLPPTGPQPHMAVSQPCSLRARYLPHSRYEKQGPGNRGLGVPSSLSTACSAFTALQAGSSQTVP